MKWLTIAALFSGVNALSVPKRAEAKGIIPDGGPSCGIKLTNPFEFPHLIIPVDSSNPDHAPGTSYDGEVSDTITSLFNFDIPNKPELNRCTLVFILPTTSQRSYTFEGDGKVRFDSLRQPATEQTTYNNRPRFQVRLGDHVLKPGRSIEVANFACPQGQRIGFQVSDIGTTNLKYFQDYSPPPIGLYVNRCHR